MDKDYIIFQRNGLFGAKDQMGNVVIKPQYKEMNPFSCGLSLVQDDKLRYTYINPQNKILFPFGHYAWCDPIFVSGVARVMRYEAETNKEPWGIINRYGQIIVSLSFDSIQPICSLNNVKASQKGEDRIINLLALGVRSKDDSFENVEALRRPAFYDPKRIRHSLDVGPQRTVTTKKSHPFYTHLDDCESEDWSDSYGDERAYNDGWNKDDVENGQADAFEGDYDECKSR